MFTTYSIIVVRKTAVFNNSSITSENVPLIVVNFKANYKTVNRFQASNELKIMVVVL